MYTCELCNGEFSTFQLKANHVRWDHVEMTEDKKINLSEGTRKSNEKRFGKILYENILCSNPKCSNETEIQYREGKKKDKYYCSRSCSNSRGPMDEKTKRTISEKVKDQWKIGKFDNIDKTSQYKMFSSKKEREIVKYFKENYPNDIWKSGGLLRSGDSRISRDLYSDILKICIEYDGIWHFKDIKGQLEKKKRIDLELERWCRENGYRLIRIQEQFFISMEHLSDLVYNNKEKIIKIGNLY
jgi:hypothetical protein